MTGTEEELINLVESIDEACRAAGMEISAEKTKVMCNKKRGFTKGVEVGGVKLEEVTSFKYLGATISEQGSKPEIVNRIAQATAALAKLQTIWRDNYINLSSKIRLMRSLVASIFLYACESWTLNSDLERRIRAFEQRCFRRLLGISYKDIITNSEVNNRIRQAIGPFEELLTTVRKRTLKWFGHVTRGGGLAKTFLQGTVPGKRGRGRPRKNWGDNIRTWTGLGGSDLLEAARNRDKWRRLVCQHSEAPLRPPRLWDR